jgi:hypothetical protein
MGIVKLRVPVSLSYCHLGFLYLYGSYTNNSKYDVRYSHEKKGAN